MDFYKIDIDISKEIAEYIGIEIVPTFVVYRDGKICGYTTGVLPEETLEERIRNVKKIIGESIIRMMNILRRLH